jgi:ribosomal-protein-alanine N-acetyltransferase
MKKAVELLTHRLKIITLQVDHITSEYVKGLNDPEVNKFLVDVRLNKQTRKKIANFISHNLDSPKDIFLGVFLRENNSFIGTIRIGDISNFHYSCNIGICLFAKECWGKGYASESLREVCDFIFKKLKLHYIEAGAYADNFHSMRLFEKAGFRKEAIYKDKYRYRDDFAPVVFWGLTNTEFDKSVLRGTNDKQRKTD